ncbi:MAG: fructuronate reductase [Gammaproteobacteria bacterium]|jgi:fructuronate reductase|nr:fructuronate reductase [Gammaproteobacteria bacterium]
MMHRLNREALARLPPSVRRPDYDFEHVGVGIVHLGLGAFHRAHQAVFTEDALSGGGDWGILGVSLRHPAASEALAAQDHLYTVETLASGVDYRVVAAIRASLCAPTHRGQLQDALASPQTHIVTLTVTEKGYCLGADGQLDFTRPEISRDLEYLREPTSAIGWIAYGLAARAMRHRRPITVISCDNLQANGTKLGDAVTAFIERSRPEMLSWLRDNVLFPRTVVDCIVPAATDAMRLRTSRALDLQDTACVQREAFSQWVIEDRFAGPRPAWDRVGVEMVDDVVAYGRLKLHVLNACHSALAYLGLPRGYTFVREAIADADLARFLNELVSTEIAPALNPLPVLDYWRTVRARFANPRIDYRLSQVAEDGSLKVAERIFPLIIANAATGAPVRSLSRIVRGWLESAVGETRVQSALDDPTLFPLPIRGNASLRAAILEAVA